MSKAYKQRRTLTGLPIGRRVQWLPVRVTEDSKRIYLVYALNLEGLVEYVGWTGQIGVVRTGKTTGMYTPAFHSVAVDKHHLVVEVHNVSRDTNPDDIGKQREKSMNLKPGSLTDILQPRKD